MKKPLSFGATMLASALGVVIASLVGGIISFIMMISMVVALGSMSSDKPAAIASNSVLKIDLASVSGERTGSSLQLSFGGQNSIGLVDALQAVRSAATDDKVCALYIVDPGAVELGWAGLEELRGAIADFSASGKPVVAYATAYSQGGYYLASVANRVCLHPAGAIDFRGISSEVMFYKELFDKLGVDMQLIRPESCAYKSAGEVYTMSHMSEANREQIRTYVKSIWNTVLTDISASRSIGRDRLNDAADRLVGYIPAEAVNSGLADTLCFEQDVKQMLKEQCGGKEMVSIARYASNVKSVPQTSKNRIALIYAEGNVVDGKGDGFSTAVYGDDVAEALRSAAADDDVKAIVLRVNSPGGQATASETMTSAVIKARAKKPVVVSMGGLAASAGYELSCMANCIVAQPTTITGSIGVFSVLPNVGKMMSGKLGLTTDTVKTNNNSADLSVMRPLSATSKALMYRSVEDFYKTFVGRVAEGRHMAVDDVQRVARGRVWTGADAIGIGLVDTLGGIQTAIDIAARLADIDSYRIVEYPKEKDFWQQLSQLMGNDDDDNGIFAKMRLAWMYKKAIKAPHKAIGRVEQDLLFVAEHDGLQARLPFVVVAE
ncbi:MAG: signal peptide peptidase SppA [Bacteroidales bacterium]|nr:signal peptide peptidase SppA [Bacteroidales bacterium]